MVFPLESLLLKSPKWTLLYSLWDFYCVCGAYQLVHMDITVTARWAFFCERGFLFLFYFNLSSVITLWQNKRNLLFLLQKQNHGTTMAFFPIRASMRIWNLHNPLELCLGITNQSSFNRSADCTVLCFQPLASPCSRPLCAALLCPWELCWPPHRRPGIPTSPSINKEQLTRRLPLFLPIH